MPELPEVESVRRSLEGALVGQRITGVTVNDSRLRVPVPTRRLRGRLPGRRILALRRRSKYLLVDLEEDQHLLVHLGMSGVLYLTPPGRDREKHLHVIFELGDGQELRYRDPRRFGQIDLVRSADLPRDRRLTILGPEPLSDELDAGGLYLRSRRVRQPIKNFIMDARNVVGVGNIYACEALHRAGIHPRRAAGRLGRQSWERLLDSIRELLTTAILRGGTTVSDFKNGHDLEGGFQDHLEVYHRLGQPCSRCQRPIRKLVLSGRSSFYCPGCQR